MKKTIRVLASTLTAATLVGSASAAANACDGPRPDGTRTFSQFMPHQHRHLSFAQRKALIVARLVRADQRLSAFISQVSAAAQADPNGWEAQALPRLQQKQAKLEALIAAVRTATDDRQIADAFRAAFGSSPDFSGWHS